jgi:hypothetical protein
MNYDVRKTLKQLDPSPGHPYNMWLHSRGRSSISSIDTARVRAVRFLSTHRSTLSASPARGPPAAAGPPAPAGSTSARGRRLVLVKSVSHTGPTYVYNISFELVL